MLVGALVGAQGCGDPDRSAVSWDRHAVATVPPASHAGAANSAAASRPEPHASSAASRPALARVAACREVELAPPRDASVGGQSSRCWARLTPPDSGWPGWWTARDEAGVLWHVRLATRAAPRPIDRALAATRVAEALGLDRVTAAQGVLVPVETLGALLAEPPTESDPLHEQLSVGNDGAVRALVERPCRGRALDVSTHPLVAEWAKLATSAAAPSESKRGGIDAYVQLVVLDFLTTNLERRLLYYDERDGTGCLDDHRGAFPGYVAPIAIDTLLDRLRPIRHFPRGLARALERLDRPAAESMLRPGAFSSWLATPRDVTDLLERRATLRTLLHARGSPSNGSAAPDGHRALSAE